MIINVVDAIGMIYKPSDQLIVVTLQVLIIISEVAYKCPFLEKLKKVCDLKEGWALLLLDDHIYVLIQIVIFSHFIKL